MLLSLNCLCIWGCVVSILLVVVSGVWHVFSSVA